MTNPLRGEVEISLADKAYKCRLTMDAMMQIEASTGQGIIKLATDMGEGDISVTNLLHILTPALRGGGNDVDAKQVSKIVEVAGIIPATQAVASLLTDALTDKAEPEGDAKKPEG